MGGRGGGGRGVGMNAVRSLRGWRSAGWQTTARPRRRRRFILSTRSSPTWMRAFALALPPRASVVVARPALAVLPRRRRAATAPRRPPPRRWPSARCAAAWRLPRRGPDGRRPPIPTVIGGRCLLNGRLDLVDHRAHCGAVTSSAWPSCCAERAPATQTVELDRLGAGHLARRLLALVVLVVAGGHRARHQEELVARALHDALFHRVVRHCPTRLSLRVWPIRCTRSIACRSTCGLKSES